MQNFPPKGRKNIRSNIQQMAFTMKCFRQKKFPTETLTAEIKSVALENCEFENLQNKKNNTTFQHFNLMEIQNHGRQSRIVQSASHQKKL